MKSLFIDCNQQLAPVFAHVHRADDPPIAINATPFTSADLPGLLAGYTICLDDHSYLPTEQIAQCPGLRHVVFLGTGAASYMDIRALRELGVTVHTIKGYGDTAVAEHTMALIFACARDIARMDREVRAGTWQPAEGLQLAGKTLSIIGLGGIGREVALRARAFAMPVIACDPLLPEWPADFAWVTTVPRDRLFADAEVLSVHVPLTAETRGAVGAPELALMRKDAILVHCARGGVVDEDAVLEALTSGQLAGAALDVFGKEPPEPAPLFKHENLIASPHLGASTREAQEKVAIELAEVFVGFLKDGIVRNAVSMPRSSG